MDDVDRGDAARICLLAVDAGDDDVVGVVLCLGDALGGDDEPVSVLEATEADETTTGVELGVVPVVAEAVEGGGDVEEDGACGVVRVGAHLA